MRRLFALILLAVPLWGQSHPRIVLTPALLSAMKQRARDNTVEWRALKGDASTSLTCDWATQTTAGTPDGMPPVYASREPSTYGTPTGYIRTGTDGAYYQGSDAWVAMTNLATCWVTLKDGDVDIAESPPGTADELAIAAKYGDQAIKILGKFTAPFARAMPTTPPARWENRTWRPIWYITNDGPATGCGSGTQLRVYLYYHKFAGGEPLTFSGVLGLTSLNSGTYRVASSGISSTAFLLEDLAGAPVCATAEATNYNHNPIDDDGYPIRFFVAGVATVYDWMFSHSSMTAGLKSQIADHIDAFIGEFKNYDNSLRDVQYETSTMTNYHWGPYSALAIAGAAIDDARADVWYDDWRNSMHLMRDQPFADRWMKNNTGFFEAWRYSSLGLMQLAFALEAARTAKGDDLINHPTQPFPFVLDMMRWLKHNLQPNGTRALDRGYVGPPNGSGQLPYEANRLSVGSWWVLQHLADIHDHPLKNKFRKFLADSFATMSGLTGYPSVTGWSVKGPEFMRFMFWNPSGTQAAWDDEATELPTMSNPAGRYGAVYMRQDWTTSAVYGAFTAHPYVSDVGNNKERYDKGSLLVQRGNVYLTVNPLAECVRGMPATPGSSPEYTAAANCYNAILNQGANASYLGSAYNNIFYLYKPGQAEGPLSSLKQGSGNQKLGTYNPWSPGSDKYPDAMQPSTPYRKARTYTVDPDTDTFTSNGHGFSNGDPALFTSGSGLTEGAVPGGLARGTRYFVRDAATNTFKVAATSGGAAIDITDAGTGTQYVYSGKGPSNTTRMVTTTHPTRIDLYESGTGYVYARGVGLHYVYQYDPVYTTHYPYENWQREVVYLNPKVFVVYDKTQKTSKSTGTAKTITGATNAVPIQITTSTDHGYHTGMTVTVSGVTGNAAANGTWTISVSGKTTFTLDGSAGNGDYAGGGTISGTVFYKQFLAWMTGKTPAAASAPEDATRYHVQDGAIFKGAITTLLPANNTGSVVNFGGYGLLYQIRAFAPTDTDTTQWLTVLDAADRSENVASTIRLASNNIDVVQLGPDAVVGFVPGNSPVFPLRYVYPGQATTTHTLAGFAPNTALKVAMNPGGEIIISASGPGDPYTSSAAGLLRFTSYPFNAARVVGVTSQKAFLRYTAPDAARCQVQVSPSPEFSSLVDDVNPALFPGSDQDEGGLRARIFVVGNRAALTPGTQYYFRATCGASLLLAQFQTKTSDSSQARKLSISLQPPASLAVDHIRLEYGTLPDALSYAVTQPCSTACKLEVPTYRGTILYLRRRYRNAAGADLAVSRTEPVFVK